MLNVVVQPSVQNVQIRVGKLEEAEDHRAEHGQRDRAEQDDERIAEAVELRGQHQEDQHERQERTLAGTCCPSVRNCRDSPV